MICTAGEPGQGVIFDIHYYQRKEPGWEDKLRRNHSPEFESKVNLTAIRRGESPSLSRFARCYRSNPLPGVDRALIRQFDRFHTAMPGADFLLIFDAAVDDSIKLPETGRRT
jgi:hypothetical protein